ncbi:MAG: Asp-tRNA(Asn)/Glu-tRNA(Gln) amidotransferase subunit GatA [Gemmatimonadetes bacterium]|jgi:aspartyl-tRNA(Asn)/glutamyl-tRNA(Gln) amidotransferase subunit A|nr:Asp-tRNA(Asn)/Glu-tRNA(Gln) amidotransferase subunit GatA [Gemmatimonadota bacterium]MBT5055757.1 Asp-tRNA(Asn)/Glu-tRNA(Gln) amidotransferase subunit GatA [Gemmatimonadota bacterium]MBT5141760.1 Asp-tRNA(Asn)/Glu-tRNA(Gln) amidotransferase subunit GatA [Gemmatimonadota bacterium]MBT5591063.1 Asp-tRNA(Asn)/Glu-tRNA(Gln) amidotransferase subunit GatA [Gemmatimonadota bacterium]MBT5962871.1 Asp-tRNA(Asn)/Glu-tRNA(Gln) amidotransferase subunit GatA [Gemmatimonadota bacterium]
MSQAQWTAHEAIERQNSGDISSVELTQAVIERIDAENGRINAYVHVDAPTALSQAEQIDARRHRGEQLGPLAGVPIAIKDVMCVRGGRTTCGSRILQDYVAPYDATAVSRLRSADAVLLGKTNMDEFAMGSSNENSHFGPTRNPHSIDRVPGGSSGGSAAAVAAHAAIAALGSDTGGSVRQPAGYCGIVGLKPSYGRVSRYGLVAYASSLDQIGPLTKDVEDTALLLGVISGHDPRDATSVDIAVPDYREKLQTGVEGLTIGMPEEYFAEGLDSQIAAAVEGAAARLEKAGAKLKQVSLPVAGHADYCVGAYYVVATAEASANLSRFDGVRFGYRAEQATDLQQMYHQSRSKGFGDEVKRRIMLGTYVLSAGYYDAYYLKAQKVRTLIRDDFSRAFEECDLLLGPVAPTTAFAVGEKIDDPLQMYLNDIYTVTANLAGLPGVSVPIAHADDGLPIGAQLLAPAFAEETLLRAAYSIEQMAN